MENQHYLSYYMEFDNKYTGNLNKYGGLPTHLPTQWPIVDKYGDEMTFICQLYCDYKILSIPNTLCIQVYQLIMNGVEASSPIIVQVPIGAKENVNKIGLCSENLPEGDINFKEVEEEIPPNFDEFIDQNGIYLLSSKLGGYCPIEEVKQDVFLGTIHDGEGGIYSPFSWGSGYSLVVYLNEDNQVIGEMI